MAIAGATLALVAAVAAGFVLGRESGDARSGLKARSSPPASAPSAPTPTPVPKSALGKGELIAAAALAADAAAAGRPFPEALEDLTGRDFVLSLAFGCPSRPGTGQGDLQASYDEKTRALRVRAATVRWQPSLVRSGTTPSADASATDVIEGFWIPRPWTASEACPTAPDEAKTSDAAEHSLGLAQIFAADGSRVGRRDGKAFETVERIAPEALDLSRGLQLQLKGKVARWAGIGPVLCRDLGDARPVCLLAVSLDVVTIGNPKTGETLASWDVANQRRETTER